jgi:hypothetical protein
MGEDLLLVIVGAILGFLSASFVELLKGRMANKQRDRERALESKDELEKSRKEFLASFPDKKIVPAWLTLVKTNTPIALFRKAQTDDADALPVFGEQMGDESAGTSEPTIQKFLLSQTQIIGRDEECEIRLADSTVSRLHAVIRYEEGCFVLYDLGSKSGTYINSKRLNNNTGKILEFGDHLIVGESVLIFYGNSNSSALVSKDLKPASTITKPPRGANSRQKPFGSRNPDPSS